MYLEDVSGFARFTKLMAQCDVCQVEYRTCRDTAERQMAETGTHQCRRCSSSRAGKKTAAKMSATYSKMYSGDGNFAKKPGVGEKISKTNKGRKLTEAHKKALRKPKSKTDKIKEAANRPEERKRRSERMKKDNPSKRVEVREKISNSVSKLVADGKTWRMFDVGPFSTSKTKGNIVCRSELERVFLEKLTQLEIVESIESAEHLRLLYVFDGVQRRYHPDFRVTLTTGEVMIVETKNSYLSKLDKTKAKEEALKLYCLENGLSCFLVTEKEMESWLAQLASPRPPLEPRPGTSKT